MTKVPTSLTIERDCMVTITTQESKYTYLSKMDNKIEVDIFTLGDEFHYQFTTADFLKVLKEADDTLTSSRLLQSL